MSASALRALSRISAAIFGTVQNPSNRRNGLKELRKNLIGPAIVHYYPAAASMWTRFDKDYQDEDTEYAISKAARLRRRGKGPPKKGAPASERAGWRERGEEGLTRRSRARTHNGGGATYAGEGKRATLKKKK